MAFSGFVFEIFCKGYTIWNTLLIVFLAFVLLFLLYRTVKKFKIKINKDVFIGVIFLEAFLTIVRVLGKGDLNVLSFRCDESLSFFLSPYFYLVSPMIYVVGTVFGFLLLLFFLKVFRENAYKRFLAFNVLLFAFSFLIFLVAYIRNFGNFFIGIFFFVVTGIVILALIKTHFKRWFRENLINYLTLFSQNLDASITLYATSVLGFGEKHVLSGLVVTNLSPAVFFMLKIAVTFFLIFLIDREIRGENFKNILKLLILVVGFGAGFRNLLVISV